MIKEFFKNSYIYAIGTILTRGIGIILIPIYTRYLSPSEYGLIDLFMILSSIISLTIALEIHQAVVRFYQDTKDEDEKRQYVSSAFIFSVFIYILYFIISYLFSDTFTILMLNDIKYENIFLLASSAIATGGLFYFTSSQLRWQILPKQSVIVSIFHITIVASIAIYLLTVENMKVESIFIGQIFGNIFGTVISIYFTQKSYQMVFNYEKFKELVCFSYPLVFSGISIFIALYIDRIVIKELLGLSELGIYGLAYRFASITTLVMIAFQSSLSPLIYKHYKEEKTPENISKLFDGFIVFALFIVSASILFSKEIVVLVSTKEYYSSSILIAPLIIAVFFSNMYIFVPGLAIAKKTKIIAFISAISAVINIILNYTMIPLFGLLGASYATMFSAIIVFFIYVFISQRYYYINYYLYKNAILFIIVLICSHFVNNLFNTISISIIIIKIITIFGIMLFLISILIKQCSLKKYLNFVSNKF